MNEYDGDVKVGLNEIRKFGPYNLLRALRVVLIAALGYFALSLLFRFSGWAFTSWQLDQARAGGVYATAEEGMRQRINNKYRGISRVDITYAGPDDLGASHPYVWYVIAEVRAASYVDGSPVRHNGCDNPGMFFVQTQDGWVHVSEGAIYLGVGHWMNVFGWAGPGQVQPAIDHLLGGPRKACP